MNSTPAASSPPVKLLRIAGLLIVAMLGAAAFMAAPRDGMSAVAVPLVFILAGGVIFAVLLWRVERGLPLFEIGTVFVAAIVAYAAAPLVVHLASSGVYTVFHARQMSVLAPSHEDVGRFAWHYVVFLYVFAATYLGARGRARQPEPVAAQLGPNELRALAIIYIVGSATVLISFAMSGANFDVAYEPNALSSAVQAYESLPLVARQLLHNLYGLVFFAKLGLLVFLVSNWRRPLYRWITVAWLALMTVQYLGRMGARTEIMLTFLAVALLYHRFVKRLTVKQAAIGALVLICAFEAFSLLRGGEKAAARSFDVTSDAVFMLGGEFQIGFAGAFHLDHMIRSGIIQHVPWQVHVSEFISLFPQQILPFEKLDPQEWYLAHAGIAAYFMLSPIAQAAAGAGMAEVVLRAMALGLLFAGLHRWYLRDPNSMMRNVFYLGMILWSYFSIRATSFGFVYWWVYRFLPFLVAYVILKHLPRLRAAAMGPPRANAG